MPTCPSCGKVHQSATICPYCYAKPAPEPEKGPISDTKENRVILAQIATKEEQLKYVGQTGPFLLLILGLFALLAYGLGIILIIIAIVWGNSREKEKKIIQGEINALRAGLE